MKYTFDVDHGVLGRVRPPPEKVHMVHAINWFEIPAIDFDRAVDFYSTVLDREILVDEMEQGPYGMFQTEEGEVSGAITRAGDYAVGDGGTTFSMTPGDAGTTVYLTVTGELPDALSTAERAGGTVLVPSESLEDGGHYAVIEDTEGNRVGLTSEE